MQATFVPNRAPRHQTFLPAAMTCPESKDLDRPPVVITTWGAADKVRRDADQPVHAAYQETLHASARMLVGGYAMRAWRAKSPAASCGVGCVRWPSRIEDLNERPQQRCHRCGNSSKTTLEGSTTTAGQHTSLVGSPLYVQRHSGRAGVLVLSMTPSLRRAVRCFRDCSAASRGRSARASVRSHAKSSKKRLPS